MCITDYVIRYVNLYTELHNLCCNVLDCILDQLYELQNMVSENTLQIL